VNAVCLVEGETHRYVVTVTVLKVQSLPVDGTATPASPAFRGSHFRSHDVRQKLRGESCEQVVRVINVACDERRGPCLEVSGIRVLVESPVFPREELEEHECRQRHDGHFEPVAD
jgi:hypothetical protein